MKQCSWQNPDDYCMSSVEGRTEFCPRHNRLLRKIETDQIKAISKRKSISKQSSKMKDALKEYNARVKLWKVENPDCKAMVDPDCTGETRDCHHIKKRGDLLMVEKYWLPVCGYCHDWIGRNSDEARQRGFTINHLEPEFIEPHIL